MNQGKNQFPARFCEVSVSSSGMSFANEDGNTRESIIVPSILTITDLKVRRILQIDLSALCQIEQEVPGLQWSLQDFQTVFQPSVAGGLVAEVGTLGRIPDLPGFLPAYQSCTNAYPK